MGGRILDSFTGSSSDEHYDRLQRMAVKDFTFLTALLMILPPVKNFHIYFCAALVIFVGFILHVALFSISCIYSIDDFAIWSETVHHTGLALMVIFINCVLFVRKQSLLDLLSLYVDGIYVYTDGLNDPIFQIRENENEKRQRKLLLFPVFVMIVTGLILGMKPIMDYVMEVVPDQQLIDNGVAFNIIIPVFYPFPVDDMTTILVANAFLLTCFASVLVATLIVCNLLFIRISSKTLLELALLVESLNLIEKRAKRLYKKRYGPKAPSWLTDGWNLYQDCIASCLKENITHHKGILRFHESFSGFGSPAVGGAFLAGSICLALAMIVMTMGNVSVTHKIAFAGVALAEASITYMVSRISELIDETHEDVYNAIYGVKWYYMDRRNKRLIISFLDGARKHVFLNAFGMAKINMELFRSVINTAYSLLNLIMASDTLK